MVRHVSALWDDGELLFSYLHTEFLSFRRRTGEHEEAMDDASGSVSAGYDNRGQVFPSEPAGKKVFERDIDNGEKSLSQSSITTGEQFLSQHPLFLLSSRTGELSFSLLSPRTGEIYSLQQLSSYRDYVHSGFP